MKGYRTYVAMGIALVAALYQQFAGELPVVPDSIWNIAVPVVALILRSITTTPPGQAAEK